MEAPSHFPSPYPTMLSTLFPLSVFYPPAPLAVMRSRLHLARHERLLRCSMHRPVNGVHIAPPQKREADSWGLHRPRDIEIFQLRDTRIWTGIARNNNRLLSLNRKVQLLSRKKMLPRHRGGWKSKDSTRVVDEAGATSVPASNLIRDKIMPDIFLRWRTGGGKGRLALRMSCHSPVIWYSDGIGMELDQR